MKDAVCRLIKAPPGSTSEQLFNSLAIRLFRFQFDRNRVYREFCCEKGVLPHGIEKWEDIPSLPVTAFKWAKLVCRPLHEARRCFHSSGTTNKQVSRHYLFDLEASEAAVTTHFKRHLLPERERMRLMILAPSPEEAPEASLSYMMALVLEQFGTEDSGFYIEAGRLKSTRLARDMADSEVPIALLGTSLAFARFIEHCQSRKVSMCLPPGSRLMDTGGSKGRLQTCDSKWIYEMAGQLWGIPPAFCVNEYGMAEMSSQFYDRIAGDEGPRVYAPPPQVSTQVLSPETLKPVKEGEMGLLAHLDLANIDSVAALLTEDLGRKTGNGFMFSGRLPSAAPKGCSLSAEALLQRSAWMPA